MANLILPAETDLALALREPNLLVPGRKPLGNIVPNSNHILTPYIKHGFDCSKLTNGSNGFATPSPINGELFDARSAGIVLSQIPGVGLGIANDSASEIDYLSINLSAEITAPYLVVFGMYATNLTHDIGVYAIETSDPFIFWDTTGGGLRLGLFSGSAVYSSLPVRTSPFYAKCAVLIDEVSGRHYGTAWENGQKTIDNADLGSASTFNDYRWFGIDSSKPGFWPNRGNTYSHLFIISGIRPSNALCQSLSLDPWQLVRSANDTPYLISVPTGGATVTLSSPTATVTSSTTATVGCTVTYT